MTLALWDTEWLGSSVVWSGSESEGHGFEMVGHKPSKRLWWVRKPKDVEDDDADESLESATEAIVSAVAKGAIKGDEPAKIKRATKEAIKPIAAEMPGFDWQAMYRQAMDAAQKANADSEQAMRAQIIESFKRQERLRIEQDEDDLAILAMLL